MMKRSVKGDVVAVAVAVLVEVLTAVGVEVGCNVAVGNSVAVGWGVLVGGSASVAVNSVIGVASTLEVGDRVVSETMGVAVGSNILKSMLSPNNTVNAVVANKTTINMNFLTISTSKDQ